MNDWVGYTRLMKTLRFYICITVSRQEYHNNVPFPALDCNANKILDLVYENAPECTVLK